MKFGRSAGVLLHPTSFPGPGGIGTLGSEARSFVDFLAKSSQQLWQILPLGPTGFGDSPYQCFSAFAGNPLLIDLGDEKFPGPTDRVDYGALFTWKYPQLRRRYEAARSNPALDQFIENNHGWLPDFALFMALKSANSGLPWNRWPRELASRSPEALDAARKSLADEVRFHQWMQFLFFEQWMDLKGYANCCGIRVIGDIPIFISYDSSDVWAHPENYFLDELGNPTVIAGVPPDYFSVTGQRWGNPHYRWDVMAETGYAWWIERIRQTLKLVDIIRVDHFRGFEAYWEVPASEETAVKGRWVKGPGLPLFRAIENALGTLPIIAEDLGLITPEVVALRDATGYPGMRILQFAFASDRNDPFLPHNYVPNTVAYTGTHDNDTVLGWFQQAPEKEQKAFLEYSGHPERSVSEEMIRLVMESVADTVIIPLQDLLGLGPEARMNIPGKAAGNWSWRYEPSVLSDDLALKMKALTERTNRALP